MAHKSQPGLCRPIPRPDITTLFPVPEVQIKPSLLRDEDKILRDRCTDAVSARLEWTTAEEIFTCGAHGDEGDSVAPDGRSLARVGNDIR